MSHLNRIANHLRSIFDTEASGRLILYSPLVGVVAGLGAAAFFYLLEQLQSLALGSIEGYYPPSAGDEVASHAMQMPEHWWAVMLVPTLGGLVCGILVYGFAPEAEGHGTDAMVRSFHRLSGRIRGRVPIIKSLASIVTIGTGGSAGREGPIAQIGAGFGSFLAERLGLGDQERRLLMLAGGAGGIGAIFRAPLGGALFVSEVLYGSTALEFAAVVPCFIASITAYSVFAAFYGQGLAFHTPSDLAFDRISELPIYLVFAVVCGLAGYAYVSTFYGIRNRVFKKLPIPDMFKPAIGGLLLGVVALFLPQLMSGGYGWIQLAINGKLTLALMAVLCVGKIVTTSLTISSGGSGGVFAPSLFIGAMLGGAYAECVNQLFPGAIVHPEAYVLVGMGGFFAGVARVPLTAMLMVCEMSGSYGLLVPLMLVSIMNTALLSSKWTLYEEQVNSPLDSPAHAGDFVIDVLEQIHVRDVFDASREMDLVQEDMPIDEILRLAAQSHNTYFPVVDQRGRMTGIFSLRDLRAVLTGNGAGMLIRAIDLAVSPVLSVTPDDDLHTAIRRFTQKNIDYLPVVDPEDDKKILGLISRREVIGAYHNRVSELRHVVEQAG
ncbi:MAG: chloride channel protein [Planctomycetaceae bacterium]|nr:chloride channel protein [Planctomycetales bacterium]MCB9924136.1 chloride channel protein [Planctomycetaceae bacterium]